MRDVASRAGVSLKTVSRVVNGEVNVSTTTKTKVQKVIDELNFVPNQVATIFSRGRALSIGIVMGWGIQTAFYATLMEALLATCQSINYRLSLFKLDEHVIDLVKAAYGGKQIEGLLLDTIAGINEELISYLKENNIPFMIIHPGQVELEPEISYVAIDDYKSTENAVKYLTTLGHTSVGCILLQSDYNYSIRRFKAYEDVMSANGMTNQEDLIYLCGQTGGASFNGGYEGAKHLLAVNKDMTAIFCQTDETAMGAISAVWQSGKRVPEDVSIIGFDDIYYATMVVPQLTTIHQPIEEIAEAAVTQLLQLIDDPASGPFHTVLETKLVVRDSTKIC